MLVTLFQTQFLPGFLPGITQFIPDLLLLVIIAWSLLLEDRWAIPIAFGAGLFMDLVAPSLHPIGLNALFFTAIALVISLVTPNSANNTIIRSVPVALVGAASYHLARLLAERVLGYNNLQTNVIFQIILPLVVIDAALMVVVFVLVRLVTRIKAPRQ